MKNDGSFDKSAETGAEVDPGLVDGPVIGIDAPNPTTSGTNSAGERVGAGVVAFASVLEARFRDIEKENLRSRTENGIVDSRFDGTGRPRPIGQKPVGRRHGHVEVDVTKPATQAELDAAREKARRMPLARVSAETGLSEKVLRKLIQ